MIKRVMLFFLGAVTLFSCGNENNSSNNDVKNKEVTVHEIDELRLTLPSSYKYINAVQELNGFFEQHGGKIAQTDPGLLNAMVDEIEMDKRFYFDGEAGDNFNYVYFDGVGPRFPLQDQIINNYIGMYEKQCALQYASRQYKLEKLSTERMTVLQNEIVNIKHKHSLDDLVWYTDHYYIQMQGNRRSLILISHDYNGGGLNLRDYLTTVY